MILRLDDKIAWEDGNWIVSLDDWATAHFGMRCGRLYEGGGRLYEDVEDFMSLVEEEDKVATVCAITQCVACLTYIDVALAHS